MSTNVHSLTVVPETEVPSYKSPDFALELSIGTGRYRVEGYPVRRWYAIVEDPKLGRRLEPCRRPDGELLQEALLAAVTGKALSL